MSVLCEAISVLVPVEVLMRAFPGGPAAYERAVSNETFCSDGVLTRVGFMHPHDVGFWIERLEDVGLTCFRQKPDGTADAIDIVVVDQLNGPTSNCDWIETEVISGTRAAWLSKYGKGDFATPAAWRTGQSDHMEFHSNEEEVGMVIVRGESMDETIDPESGATQFIARTFESERSYDEAMRCVKISVEVGDLRDAHQNMRRAEGFRELRDQDKYAAADICYRLCSENAETAQAMGPESARRWREVVDLAIAPQPANALFKLARSEGFAGNWESSAICLDNCLKLDPEDPYVLAERAFVSIVRREPSDVSSKFLFQAMDAAGKRLDKGALEYIKAVMDWRKAQKKV